MALINCWECGKQISDQAIKCPNCGALKKNTNYNKQQLSSNTKDKTKNNQKTKYFLIALGIVIFISIIAVYLNNKSTTDFIFAYKAFKRKDYQEAITKLNELKPKYEYKKEAKEITSLIEKGRYPKAKLKFKSVIFGDHILYQLYQEQGLSDWRNAAYYTIPRITLYYEKGENKILIGKIVNITREYDPILQTVVDCVNVKFPNGTIDCKAKEAVATWYVNEDDPMIRCSTGGEIIRYIPNLLNYFNTY